MGDSNGSLTLEGLAQILRDHMDGTAAEFAEERADRKAQDAQWRARMDELRERLVTVVGLVHEMSQTAAWQAEELAEHRQQIHQIFSRMEQQDARIEGLHSDIRRILDAMEQRGGNGGSRPE